MSYSPMDTCYHAVALEAGKFVTAAVSRDLRDLAQWCLCSTARVVAVNGPSHLRVRSNPAPRLADKELKAAKLVSWTPRIYRKIAWLPVPDFRWELNQFYGQLRPTFPLYAGDPAPRRFAIETNDRAATEAFCVEPRKERLKWCLNHLILRRAGLDPQLLRSHNCAAMSALVAQAFLDGNTRNYGEAATGLIVMPRVPLPARPGDLAEAPKDTECPYCRHPREACTCAEQQVKRCLDGLLAQQYERN